MRPASGGPGAASIWIYGAPAMALAIPTIPVYVELPSFYASQVGLGLTATGTALLVARLADVVIDPAVGFLCEWRGSRFGRRKPWIALGAILAGLALLRLLAPPADAGASYLTGWAVVLYGGWTLATIPYTTWGAELVDGYHERARVSGVREAFSLVGILAAGVILAAGPMLGLSEAGTLLAVGFAAIAGGVPSIVALLLLVPERVRDRSPERKSFAALLTGLHRNRPFLRLIFAWLLNGFANGVAAALFPLYLRHQLGVSGALSGALIFAYFAAGVLAIPLWLALSRRFGKHRAWCAAMLLAMAVFCVVPAIQPGQWHLFLLVCILTGMTLGADLTLPPGLQADVIDYDAWRFGKPRAGMLFALWHMATKLALALSIGLAFPLLDAFGFAAEGPNDAPALTALVVIYSLLPVVVKGVAVVLVWHHPLTLRRHAAIRSRLDRKSGMLEAR